jgi:glyoxylase I family protein
MNLPTAPNLALKGFHHIAIICSQYQRSKRFYVDLLGFKVIAEHYRASRQSYKCDLALPGGHCIELFSFPNPPPRPSYPEACGLRHLALAVSQLDEAKRFLESHRIIVEPIRRDEYTNKRFTFFADPDGLPIELYEVGDY